MVTTKTATIIIGQNSFIGKNFAARACLAGISCFGTDYRHPIKQRRFDLLKPNISLLPLRSGYRYGLIAAGVTKISACEKKKKTSRLCNVTTPLELGKAFCRQGIVPIFFSSDAVFSGNGQVTYTEKSVLSPETEYGRQKAELEKRVAEEIGLHRCLVFRLSKVYGGANPQKCFVAQIAKQLLLKRAVYAACDQVFCPIHIEDVAQAILLASQRSLRGIFQLCGPKSFSRYEIAVALANRLCVEKTLVRKISLRDLNEPFFRPKRLVTSSKKIVTTLRFCPRDLRKVIEKTHLNHLDKKVRK